jgi:ParB-like chromosome segregation protein Spo0J
MAEKETIRKIPLRAIIPSFQIARSGDFTQSDVFPELRDSIEKFGQRVPVIVRPQGDQFELIAGYRRFAALMYIARANGNKDGSILAIVREMNDFEAYIENALNGSDELRPSDLMLALMRIADAARESKREMSDSQLCALVGVSRSYGARLLRIGRNAANVAKLWHTADVPLSVEEMDRIRALEDSDAQMTEYKKRYQRAVVEEQPDGDPPWTEYVVQLKEVEDTWINICECDAEDVAYQVAEETSGHVRIVEIDNRVIYEKS